MTHDLKLAVTVVNLKAWCHYLYGVHFEMFSDHNNLKYLFDQKELNMLQRRCMEYLNGFDFDLKYHLSKENKVTGVLSQKQIHRVELMMLEYDLLEKFRNLNLQFLWTQNGVMMENLNITSDLRERIRQSQLLDEELQAMPTPSSFTHATNGVLLFNQRIYIPNDAELVRNL